MSSVPSVGSVYEYNDLAQDIWPMAGPFILMRSVAGTSSWEALDCSNDSMTYVIPNDTLIYRVASWSLQSQIDGQTTGCDDLRKSIG